MSRIEVSQPNRTDQLVDRMLIIIWANQILQEYNNLPKETSRERKSVNNLVARTAAGLLQNPQDISIADKTWQRHEGCENQAQKLEEPFSELVRKERLDLIKYKWENVTPEQLAGLVRIYSNKDESQESARKSAEALLKNYFKGPRSRNQRIDAYYNFVFSVLDLVPEDEAFREGMKIALHATDILPKNPDQTLLVSLPYKKEEAPAFKKALVVNYIINQLWFMGLQDFGKYYQDRKDFVESAEVQGKFREEQHRVAKEIGNDKVKELNDKMLIFFHDVTHPLTEERKQSLKNIWPYNWAFDENDPLNQKFKRVFAENRSNSV